MPNRGVLNRLVSGDGLRPTRFHNYKGELIDLGGLAYLPHTVFSAVAYKLFGYRPAVPWIGWRATRELGRLIRPDWKILEFGSGMSTIWFAQRCAKLVSIEADEGWHGKVKEELGKRRFQNVDYRFHPAERYSELGDLPDRHFDLVLVDGIERTKCAQTALKKVKPGGYVYLDNSDCHWMEFHDAEKLLLGAAATKTYFNDFCPNYFGVNQGLLIQLPE